MKYTTAAGSAKGLNAVLRFSVNSGILEKNDKSVFKAAPRILVISPISLGENLDARSPDSLFCGKYRDSLRFAELYKPVCDQFQVEFLDASFYACASDSDWIHMDAVSHRNLAVSVFENVKQIL